MRKSLMDKLCCPFDKNDLNLKIFLKNESGDILEGLLTCPTCKRYYPVIYGIPIMTPDEYRERALEQPVMKRWLPERETEGFRLESGE
jgi:uncharacterized protein YbaR (Trm112 family)